MIWIWRAHQELRQIDSSFKGVLRRCYSLDHSVINRSIHIFIIKYRNELVFSPRVRERDRKRYCSDVSERNTGEKELGARMSQLAITISLDGVCEEKKVPYLLHLHKALTITRIWSLSAVALWGILVSDSSAWLNPTARCSDTRRGSFSGHWTDEMGLLSLSNKRPTLTCCILAHHYYTRITRGGLLDDIHSTTHS